jgi:uncharacterized membrane protein
MIPQSSADWIEFSGGVMMVGGVVGFMFSTFFCVKYLPIVIRGWFLLAIALLGARLLTRENNILPLDQYWVAAIHVHLALVVVATAIWFAYRALRKGGDRCTPKSDA